MQTGKKEANGKTQHYIKTTQTYVILDDSPFRTTAR